MHHNLVEKRFLSRWNWISFVLRMKIQISKRVFHLSEIHIDFKYVLSFREVFRVIFMIFKGFWFLKDNKSCGCRCRFERGFTGRLLISEILSISRIRFEVITLTIKPERRVIRISRNFSFFTNFRVSITWWNLVRIEYFIKITLSKTSSLTWSWNGRWF